MVSVGVDGRCITCTPLPRPDLDLPSVDASLIFVQSFYKARLESLSLHRCDPTTERFDLLKLIFVHRNDKDFEHTHGRKMKMWNEPSVCKAQKKMCIKPHIPKQIRSGIATV